MSQQKNVVPGRNPAYKLSFNPFETKTIYIRSTMELPTSLKFSLYSVDNFHVEQRTPNYIAGAYAGIMLIMIFYNLFIYFSTRDRAFLYYVLTVATVHYYLFLSYIKGDHTMLKWAQSLGEYQLTLPQLIGTIFLVQFGRVFLRTENSKITDRILKVCMGIFLAGIVSSPFISEFYVRKLAQPFTLISILTLIIHSGYLFSKGNTYARYYFLAWFPFILALVISSSSQALGLSEIFRSIVYIFLAAAAAEVLLLSLALADKINQMRKERAKEQKAHKEEILMINASLEKKVAEQTMAIRSMLENVKLGIFTITEDYVVDKDYSNYLEKILGTDRVKNRDVSDLFINKLFLGADKKDQMESAIQCSLGQTELTFDVNEKKLVKETEIEDASGDKKSIELDWTPILDECDNIDRLLVTVKDVTDLKVLREEAEKQRDKVLIIDELIHSNMEKFPGFYQSLSEGIAKCHTMAYDVESDTDYIDQMFVILHTIKGVSRGYQYKKLSDAIHKAEDVLSIARDDIDKWDANKFGVCLSSLKNTAQNYNNLFDLLSKGHQKKDQDESRSIYLDNLAFECLRGRDVLAEDLGKVAPFLNMDIRTEFQINSKGANLLQSCFVHLLRNSLDHGIELTEKRLAEGKPEAGTITITASEGLGHECLDITYRDDGAGLDLNGIRQKAIEAGILHEADECSDLQIANLIFNNGLSTKCEVSDISGRGVGMDAVKRLLEENNASIVIVPIGNSQNGMLSFEFKLSIPNSFFAYSLESELKAS